MYICLCLVCEYGEVSEAVHHVGRHGDRVLYLVVGLLIDACRFLSQQSSRGGRLRGELTRENQQGVDAAIDAEEDIGVQSVADHERTRLV